MVANANVLGIGHTNNGYLTSSNTIYYETISTTEITNHIFTPVQSWLAANPTKRPQYVILFLDVPSRMTDPQWNYFPTGGYYPYGTNVAEYPSVACQINQYCAAGWNPFVTSINMNGVADCENYIDKLKNFGNTNSPGKLVISASAGGYGNTNYLLDGIRHGTGYSGFEDYSSDGSVVSSATNGLLANGVSSSAILFYDGLEIISNGVAYNLTHPGGATNVAGYMCWGAHSSLGSAYFTSGAVTWSGNSGWYLMRTVESFNGQRYQVAEGTFLGWFSAGAFGGASYSNTPVGALSNVDEPGILGSGNSEIYFGLWAGGDNFAICAWNTRMTTCFQAVGDPFVKR